MSENKPIAVLHLHGSSRLFRTDHHTMSAILSADDLNDFISPGVACIKPVETLPLQRPKDPVVVFIATTLEHNNTDLKLL